jgi:hypothetical protein
VKCIGARSLTPEGSKTLANKHGKGCGPAHWVIQGKIDCKCIGMQVFDLAPAEAFDMRVQHCNWCTILFFFRDLG